MAAEPDLFEPHYTVGEIAKWWHMSRAKLTPIFMAEPGVIKYGAGQLTKTRKRTYVSMRIPLSVARRVYRRLTGKELSGDGLRKDVA